MVTPCAKCTKETEKSKGYEYRGKLYCEDCYMDVLSPPRACDPWAVRSAQTFLEGKDKLSSLSACQLQIFEYLKEKGEATLEGIMKNLNLTEEAWRREFAVLRHMEILKATKKNGRIYYLRFS
jgi:hypothetical protein